MKRSFFRQLSTGNLMVWTVAVVAGCSKHKPADAVTPPVTNAISAQPDNPVPAVNSKVVPLSVPDGPDASAMLAQLTQVLRRFSVEHRQVPKSLNELVAAGYLASLPAAPAGKQFAIEPKQLEVVLR